MQSVTSENFKQEVLESTVPVLVDFWAPWCRPCNQLTPILETVSQQSDGKFKIVKVNIDEQQALTEQYPVSAIPTLLLFKNGQVMNKMVGHQSEVAIQNAFAAALV